MATAAVHLRFRKFKACGTLARLRSLTKSGVTTKTSGTPSAKYAVTSNGAGAGR